MTYLGIASHDLDLIYHGESDDECESLVTHMARGKTRNSNVYSGAPLDVLHITPLRHS